MLSNKMPITLVFVNEFSALDFWIGIWVLRMFYLDRHAICFLIAKVPLSVGMDIHHLSIVTFFFASQLFRKLTKDVRGYLQKVFKYNFVQSF